MSIDVWLVNLLPETIGGLAFRILEIVIIVLIIRFLWKKIRTFYKKPNKR